MLPLVRDHYSQPPEILAKQSFPGFRNGIGTCSLGEMPMVGQITNW